MPKSTSRALEVLEALASSTGTMSHADLAKVLAIPKSSLTAVIGDLFKLGYVSQDDVTKRYELGSAVMTLARSYMENCDIVRMGRPILTRIVSEIDEATTLALVDGDQGLVVAQEVSSRPGAQRTISLGERAPLSTTSAGKIMLAFLPRDHRERLLSSIPLPRTARNSVTDRDALAAEVEQVRELGVSYSREEAIDGVIAIGVPVWGPEGQLVAALSTAVPAYRFDAVLEEKIIAQLKQGAETLTVGLGGDIRQTA